MLKQKLALISATLFLLSTVILPGLAFAQSDENLTGTLTLTGIKDVAYDGYGTGDIANRTYTGLTASTSQQTSVAQTNSLDGDDLIGVLNLKAEVFTLTVSVTDMSTTAGPTIPDNNITVATAGNLTHFTAGFQATPNVSYAGAATALTNSTAALTPENDVWYNDNLVDNDGYTFTRGDTIASLNTIEDLSAFANITTPATAAAPAELMRTTQTDAYGLFFVAFATAVVVDANQPASPTGDPYISTFTFTVS
ncbi:hypothetical protein KKG22_05050 [Patescibacteria group bacterium]|nr:hypothetical protein [Patescibacteria group bacterium]